MKIAVTYENYKIFQHFGKTAQFKLYTVDENKNITNFEIISSNGQGHGALADVLAGYGVDVLICGGIGEGAVNALKEKGIEVYGGNSGNPDSVVISFLAGKLEKQAANCNHHHAGDHDCGSHTCG